MTREQIVELRKKYEGKQLTPEELEKLSFIERLTICSCDICIPGPCYVDPMCPVHWDMSDGGTP